MRIATVIGLARCGNIININLENELAPSISDASNCSRSRDCNAVNKIKVAKGNHCQLIIQITDKSGA